MSEKLIFEGKYIFEHREGEFCLTDRKLVLRKERIEINLEKIQSVSAFRDGVHIDYSNENEESLEFDILSIELPHLKVISPQNSDDRQKALRDRFVNAINNELTKSNMGGKPKS
jgi:hypothetical protein